MRTISRNEIGETQINGKAETNIKQSFWKWFKKMLYKGYLTKIHDKDGLCIWQLKIS